MENIQNRKLKLSRRDKIRRNPLPWILILLIASVFGLLGIMPQYEDWRGKKSNIKLTTAKIPILQEKVAIAKEKWNETETTFNEAKKPVIDDEAQLFPKNIDVYNTVRILETFSIAMKNLESVLLKDTYFELESVNFGQSKKEKGITQKKLSIGFSANDENVRKFVKYIQTNSLPKEFMEIDNSNIKFLRNNLLPLMHIESISIAEKRSTKDENTQTAHYDVRLQLIVFSR